jgi:2-polyprenyl-6-methoxyphenol hydroxylase-like FAD-dependent oxidoreductase
LLRAAISLGTDIHFNKRVASIDAARRAVTLTTGDVFCADVIIGADGLDDVMQTHFSQREAVDSALVSLILYQ